MSDAFLLQADVIVVGGGLIGLSSALHLARAGASVIVLEAQYCGRHASGVNAGGVRTLGRHDAEIPLMLAARDERWHHMQDFLGNDCGFQASGQIKVIENDADAAKAQARIAHLRSLGYTHETLIDAHEVRARIPAISPHVQGAIWVARDGHANPYRTVMAFRHAALQQGVIIHERQPVRRIDQQHGLWQLHTDSHTFRAAQVVNAAGAWGGDIAGQVGEAVPIEAVGLMLMITQKVPPFIDPVLGTMSRPLSFKQFDNGSVLIGGALRCNADAGQRVADVDVGRLHRSAATVTDLFPHLRHLHLNRAWAGVEGTMPDNIPVLGHSVHAPGLVHAFGFSAHGFALSPIIGHIVCQLLRDGASELPIAAFSIARFLAR